MRSNPSSTLTSKPYAERQTCQAKPPPHGANCPPVPASYGDIPVRIPRGHLGATRCRPPDTLTQPLGSGVNERGPGKALIDSPLKGSTPHVPSLCIPVHHASCLDERGRETDPRRLAAKRGLQVTHVLLRLLEKRTQRFRHVSDPELHGLTEPLSVTLELAHFEAQIGGQRLTPLRCLHLGYCRDRRPA